MTHVQQALRNVLERMAGQLFAIFRQSMIGAWEAELTESVPQTPPARSSRKEKAAAPVQSGRVRRKNRPRNTKEEVEEIEHELVAVLKEHPGEFVTAKVLLARLGVEESPFRQALKSLLAQKLITLQGAKRSARYGVTA